jgi:hypothetical protein
MINKNKLQKLNNKELQEIVYKKINRIERLSYDLNVRKCGGSLSKLINLNDRDGQKLLQFMDYFIDQIRNEKQTEENDYYNISNNDMINEHLNKNQLIDFIEQLDNYLYQIIEDFRDYQDYKNNGFLDY